MAFRKDKTTAAQTSANAAATVVSALVSGGFVSHSQEALDLTGELFELLFERLGPVVDADNAVFEAAEAVEDSGGSKSRSRKTAGGRKTKARGRGKPSLDQALEMVMRSGAFEGESLGSILDIDADTADADYAYGDGDRDGRDYITWLASDKNKNDFTRDYARVVAEAEGLV